jgi:hypothetical protein
MKMLKKEKKKKKKKKESIFWNSEIMDFANPFQTKWIRTNDIVFITNLEHLHP